MREEFNMIDRYDPISGISSMSRTTGYTCTGAAHLIAKKIFNEKGVFPPELVGKDPESFNYLIKHLEDRNIRMIKKDN